MSDGRHNKKKLDLPLPSEIKSFLDEYIIGQEEAKLQFLLQHTTIIKESFRILMM